MASEWPELTIAECASSEPYSTQIGPFGKALMAEEYSETGVPVLRGINVNRGRFHDADFVFVTGETADRLRKFESFPGDVLLVHKGTLGEIGLMPRQRRYERYLMGNSMMRVRCDPRKLLPEYLYYWLSSSHGQNYLFSRISQVGVPQLQTPLSTLRQAALRVPPIDEQLRIVQVLGGLDEKIELNLRMSETLEEMARALFKSWFVDFEPVKAKGKGIGPIVRFSRRMEDSELGEMPEGWSATTLASVAQLNPESWSKEAYPAELLYLDLSNVKWGRIEHVSRVTRDDAPSRAQRILRPGDTIVGTVRPGNGSFALIHESGLTASTGFAALRPVSPEWTEFVYLAATAPENIEALAHLADGGAYPAIRPDVVAATPVVKPEGQVIEVFSNLVRPLLKRVSACETESRTLAALRDALLPKLISGEIRVRA